MYPWLTGLQPHHPHAAATWHPASSTAGRNMVSEFMSTYDHRATVIPALPQAVPALIRTFVAAAAAGPGSAGTTTPVPSPLIIASRRFASGIAVSRPILARCGPNFGAHHDEAWRPVPIRSLCSLLTACIHRRRDEIEAWLSIGATRRQALRDIARYAIVEALIPVLDTTRTVGLVTCPAHSTAPSDGQA